MAKRSFALGFVACVIFAVLAAVAVPGAALAGVSSYNWAETAYVGFDSFYGGSVVAYETGSTAKLTASVNNNTAGDITIKEAKIKFDWGQEYAATSYPTEITVGESGVVAFSFTVPGVDVASNSILHNYQIIVGYQVQGVSYQRIRYNSVDLGTGNGVNVVFPTGPIPSPLVPDSVKIKFVDDAAGTVQDIAADQYTVNNYTGVVTFNSAVATGVDVYASFSRPESLGYGDGSDTVFYTGASPVMTGSPRVFLANDTTETMTLQAEAAYAFVAETGKITFANAPQGWEEVMVFYEYWSRFPVVGATDFAVYSADQASARQLKQEYSTLYRPTNFIPSAEGSQLIVEADAQEALGDTAYANGDFSGAATYYQNAIDKMNAAIAADTGVNSTIEDALTGLGTGAAAWLDGQAAKADAEATRIETLTDAEANKLNAEAGFNDLYGIFLILIGVGGILGAAGAIVWAVSRLVAARRM